MTQFVYIDSVITILTLILSVGLLSWLVRIMKKEKRRDLRKGLWWIIPLVVISIIDVFVCISIITLLPGAPTGVDASDGQYTDKVVIKWKPAPKAKTYTVLRATRPDGTYDEIASNISETSFIDTTVRPGKYYYEVVASNDIGKGTQSTSDPGNRAITDFEFFNLYRMTEHGSIGKLKKLGTLGYETEPGAAGGSTSYDAKFDGRAHVTNSYSNYCDFGRDQGNHMILNGSLDTETDMMGNGTLLGKVDVTGHYSGYVKYNLVIAHKKKSGGYYSVKQSGGKIETAIPWNYQ
jgi:hypothetical protein